MVEIQMSHHDATMIERFNWKDISEGKDDNAHFCFELLLRYIVL